MLQLHRRAAPSWYKHDMIPYMRSLTDATPNTDPYPPSSLLQKLPYASPRTWKNDFHQLRPCPCAARCTPSIMRL